jgi:methylmalonyl-CoA/ethylmalonyl-CoA epimerase
MKIEHVAIAARNNNESLKFWRDALGLKVKAIETVEEQGVHASMLQIGESHIELLEPVDEGSTVARFLEKRGPGIHHIAIHVDDINLMLERLKDFGVRLIDEEPRRGARDTLVAFVHPSSAGGVLVELVQYKEERTTS